VNAHIGISIYEPASGKYWYNYNGEKYFVPASNTKIPTCYAAMKYLGDSLVGWYIRESNDTLYIKPNGDPTFLHPDFKQQRFFDLIINTKKKISVEVFDPQFQRYGNGWTWNDFDASYMPERSIKPIYGNLVTFKMNGDSIEIIPKYFKSVNNFPSSWWEYGKRFDINRLKHANYFGVQKTSSIFTFKQIPFTGSDNGNMEDILLLDTIWSIKKDFLMYYHGPYLKIHYNKFFTQPTDSLLKPMMHRSDNFFAEQSLLMVSNELLGVMNDAKIIDTLLKTDFKDLPQKPRWVDGSGLSRYNLFTPQDFVAILGKMKKEFGMERIKEIFATGGEGTISSYYKSDSGFIYAKTGTLSGVVALSGFLTTKKGKQLLFSVLVNNHNGSATAVRKAVEKFIQGIRNTY
jgi:D-alanyl-D-alanine carboxypeptidase/D-alanyl-D-alanine-endopeptidase (penicillin-binding protein 4)